MHTLVAKELPTDIVATEIAQWLTFDARARLFLTCRTLHCIDPDARSWLRDKLRDLFGPEAIEALDAGLLRIRSCVQDAIPCYMNPMRIEHREYARFYRDIYDRIVWPAMNNRLASYNHPDSITALHVDENAYVQLGRRRHAVGLALIAAFGVQPSGDFCGKGSWMLHRSHYRSEVPVVHTWVPLSSDAWSIVALRAFDRLSTLTEYAQRPRFDTVTYRSICISMVGRVLEYGEWSLTRRPTSSKPPAPFSCGAVLWSPHIALGQCESEILRRLAYSYLLSDWTLNDAFLNVALDCQLRQIAECVCIYWLDAHIPFPELCMDTDVGYRDTLFAQLFAARPELLQWTERLASDLVDYASQSSRIRDSVGHPGATGKELLRAIATNSWYRIVRL